MRKRNILIISIILMAVGFAVVTTNLIINGSAVIGNNKEDYDVIFTKAILEGTENNSIIIEDGKKIKYETKQLINVGDSSELVYEITNNSSQYDASVSINCTPKGTTTHTNLYSIDTTNTPGIIKAKNSETGSIEISLTNLATEEIKESFECTLNITAMERTTIGERIPAYRDEVLNGADPVLKDELIPVTIANDGAVIYADVDKEWYNYGNKEWANAVFLVDDPSKTYSVGEVILESDIESYFVWIPRYRYKLFYVNRNEREKKLSQSNAQTIEIEFESKEESISNGNKNGEWLTHPAFTNFDTNGVWVGKFETGYKGAKTALQAERNNSEPTNIIIKPNVYSWRWNTVGNFFKAMYNYNRNLNSHMMKNTEWGCVAYLSHSIYGINTEVRINNNSNYLTGYAANVKDGAASATETQPYNTSIGYLASTTGNITGVYDMSGGSSEYVASNRNNNVGSSGLTVTEISETYKNYFDIYTRGDTNYYDGRILGDATGEMGPFFYGNNNYRNNWYYDYSVFVNGSNPWTYRGAEASAGSSAGQFAFYQSTGGANSKYTSRLVLAF